MLKRLVAASAICLSVAVATGTGASAANLDGTAPATPATAPALYCAPTLQDLSCIVSEITHPCQTRCATPATAPAAATMAPTFDCAIPAMCQVLGKVCPNCTLDLATAAPAAAPAASIDSLPGDPCSRDWGPPIEAICHM